MPMLKMAKIGKVYRTGLVETAALEELSLEIARGDFVSLMGPSGSGKTTFLNIAGLLDTFDRGRYLLDGVDVVVVPHREPVPEEHLDAEVLVRAGGTTPQSISGSSGFSTPSLIRPGDRVTYEVPAGELEVDDVIAVGYYVRAD